MRRPPDTAWDFGPVIELLDSDPTDTAPQTPLSANRNVDRSAKSSATGTETPAVTLGSFSKLFKSLGISVDVPLLPSSLPDVVPELESESHTISDDAVQSSADDAADTLDGRDSMEEDLGHAIQESAEADCCLDVEDPFAGMTKKQRHRARKQLEKARKNERQKLSKYEAQARARKELQTRSDQAVQKQLDRGIVPKQGTARSNVGAKIKPTTSVPVIPKTPARVETPAATSNISTNFTPVAQHKTTIPAPPMSSHHVGLKPHVPQVLPQPMPPTSVGNYGPVSLRRNAVPYTPHPKPSALANLNSSLATQYTPPAALDHYQYQLPNGFVTPLKSGTHSYAPPTTPMEKTRVSPDKAIPAIAPPLTTSKLSKKLAPRSREDRNYDFLKRLIDQFPEDKGWLVSPMRLSNEKLSSTGIHVFVDASNILIGFKETLKRSRERLFDMSFDCLALLLERRRPVAKRVYAGSTRLSAPIASAEKFKDLAEAVGYEKNIYEQVYKIKEQTESQKFFKDVDRMGWIKANQRRSGSGSDSETGPSPPSPPLAPKWVEQGVDESLHLKMCQSIIDVEVPTTMVLATGDGAAAEYSDGFLAHVERALKKGWKVELVSWRQQTSGSYKNKNFRIKWGDQFKIIDLDDYLESMIDA